MPTTPNYQALRGTRLAHLSDEVRAARIREQKRRSAVAQSRAKTALTKLHSEDFRSLYAQAVLEVDSECGPLPGDEPKEKVA
jgi:hypothetical protein